MTKIPLATLVDPRRTAVLVVDMQPSLLRITRPRSIRCSWR